MAMTSTPPQSKQLMDVIKITARDLFYEAIAPFKEAYDNFRDDHVWFRHVIRSSGVLEEFKCFKNAHF